MGFAEAFAAGLAGAPAQVTPVTPVTPVLDERARRLLPGRVHASWAGVG